MSRFWTLAGLVLLCSGSVCLHASPLTDLIVNGNFEAGNTGFISQYIYQSNLWPEGTYDIGSSPQSFHSLFWSFGDHTSGEGNMMVVNGAPLANSIVWSETVDVLADTNYNLSAWVANVYPANPATLAFFVGNTQIGTTFSAPGVAEWSQFKGSFTGISGQQTISIIDFNTIRYGNDFALDDISLVDPPLADPATTPEPGSIFVVATGLIFIGVTRRNSIRAKFHK